MSNRFKTVVEFLLIMSVILLTGCIDSIVDVTLKAVGL